MTTPHNDISHERPRFLWAKRIFGIFLPVFVLVAAVVGFSAMGALKPTPKANTEEVKALPVLTAVAEAQDIVLRVSAQGEVQPRTQINVVPQISGKITYMSPQFIEGGRFKRGALLMRIEPTEYELRVVQAKANVAQAETSLTRERSERDIAVNDWKELGLGAEPSALTLREPQMAEAAARLESAKAQLAEAELQLKRTSIYAPFDGRVMRRAVNRGAFVTTGMSLGEIYATDVMDVRLPMTNQNLGEAGLSLGFMADTDNPGIPVKLTSNVAGIDVAWSGLITRTDSGFDPQTRVLFAYAEVKDPFGAGASEGVPLAPGIFVTAEIDGRALENQIVIPRAGLRGTNNVYVAESDGTLSVRTVDVVSTRRDIAILNSGIEVGEAVIISPIRGAADGMRIDVVDYRDGQETELATTDSADTSLN